MGAAVVVVGKGEGRERVHIPTQPFQSFPPGPLFMLSVILTFTCQHVASNSQLKLTSGAEQVDNNASKWVVKVNIKEYGSSITPDVIRGGAKKTGLSFLVYNESCLLGIFFGLYRLALPILNPKNVILLLILKIFY